MNRCPDARALLPAYVEGELGNGENRRVSGHLQICAACRQEEAAYRQALGAIRSAPRRESPGDLYYGFQAKLDASSRTSNRRLRQLRTWAGAAMLVLIVGISTAAVINLRSNGKSRDQVAVRRPATEKLVSTDSQANDPTHKGLNPPNDGSTTSTAKTEPQNPAGETAVKPENAPKHPKPRISKQKAVEPMPEDFLSIKPKHGQSIRERMRQAELQRMALERQGSPAPAYGVQDGHIGRGMKTPPTVEPMTPDLNERVQVGNKVTTIKTAYKEDNEGRRTAIEVNIGTASVQSP